MKIGSIYSSSLFYGVLFTLFFIDICLFSFFEKPYFNSVLCFFILSFFNHASRTKISAELIILSLAALMYYGRFGITLIYLIPITIIGRIASRSLYPAWWYPYALLTTSLLVQTVLIERIILGLPFSFFYTLYLICANLLVISVISLKR